jgi:hypothetical protein
MRVQKRGLGLVSLAAMLMAMTATMASAQTGVSSDKPGSVVIWPKVINDGTRDTIITLANTSNMPVRVHCEYVNSASFCAITEGYCTPGAEGSGGPGQCPPAPGNVCETQWTTDDFEITLTRQQPTMWRVSTGREVDPAAPADGECDTSMGVPPQQSCPGIFPIQINPVEPTFRGELRCWQISTEDEESLTAGNALKGEATLVSVDPDGNIIGTSYSTYNSINIQALRDQAGTGPIRLNGVDYAACPPAVEVSHHSAGSPSIAESIDDSLCDPTAGCPVQTQITLVPCRADFENNEGAVWTTTIDYYNEFEQQNSTGGLIDCWWNFDLRDLNYLEVGPFGTNFQSSRIYNSGSPRCIRGDINAICANDDDCGTGGVCGPPTGLLAIVEEFHNTTGSLAVPPTAQAGAAAANGYTISSASTGLQRSGRCRNNVAQSCPPGPAGDTQCGTGRCRVSGAACTPGGNQCTGPDFCDLCMNDEINTIQPF